MISKWWSTNILIKTIRDNYHKCRNLANVKCEVFKMSKTSHLTMFSPKNFWGLKQFNGNLKMYPFLVIEFTSNANVSNPNLNIHKSNVMVVIAQSPKGESILFILTHG
jgi:hypothetical protein